MYRDGVLFYVKKVSLRRVFAWCALAMLCGCSSSSQEPLFSPGTKLRQVSVVSHENMNQNTAMRLDIAVIYDKNLLAHLSDMSSVNYFSNIEQLRRDNRQGLTVFRFEMIPAQILESHSLQIPDTGKVWGILLFADYQTLGKHSAAIDSDSRTVRVILGPEDIGAVEKNTSRASINPKGFSFYPLESRVDFENDGHTQASS